MNTKLPDGVTAALAYAARSPGWNNRRDDVQRFTLPNVYGREPCILYVVPCRRWAYWRWQRMADERQHSSASV